MRRSLFGILAVGVLAWSTSPLCAGIAMEVTEAGGPNLTGGRPQLHSWGLTLRLLEENNALHGLPSVTAPTSHRNGWADAFEGMPASNRTKPVGYLSWGPSGSLLTYDRLVAVPVLQVLGYDFPPRTAGGDITPPDNAGAQRPYVGGPGPIQSTDRDNPPIFVVVPEPASLLALTLPALGLFARRRR